MDSFGQRLCHERIGAIFFAVAACDDQTHLNLLKQVEFAWWSCSLFGLPMIFPYGLHAFVWKKFLFFCTVHRIYRTNVACSTENEWDQKWKKKKQTIIVFLVNTDFYLLFCCAASINCLLLSLALAYQTAIRFVAALRFSLQLFLIISFSAYVALWVLLILCRVCVQRIERTVNATKQQAQSHGSQHTAKEMKSGVRFFSSCVWVLFCKISRCVYLTQWPNPNFSDCCC